MNFANRPRLRAALNYSRQVRNVKLCEAGNQEIPFRSEGRLRRNSDVCRPLPVVGPLVVDVVRQAVRNAPLVVHRRRHQVGKVTESPVFRAA